MIRDVKNERDTSRIDRALRRVLYRLIGTLAAFGIGASLTWIFRAEVFGYLLAPAGDRLSLDGRAIFTGPTEMFSLTIGMAIKGGIVAALPVLAYSVYSLARPLLDRQQRRTVVLFLGIILFFYLAGTAFAYFVLLPIGLGFLLQFGAGIATPMIRISEYMDLALALLFWLGIVFEAPVVMLLLAKLRIVSHLQFKRVRRYVPIAALILGALITPTIDWVSQTLVAVPLILLYELGVLLAWLVRPKAVGGKVLRPPEPPMIILY